MSVRSEIHQTVAVVRFGEPPVNSLGSTTRRDLVEAIDAAVADSRIEGIVIVGNNHLFCAGADLKEFGKPAMMAAPNLRNVITEPVPAKQFEGTPLLDRLVAGDPLPAAIQLAAEKGAASAIADRLPKVRDRPVSGPDSAALLGFARTMIRSSRPNMPAPLKCLEAIEAAVTKPFEDGLAVEQQLFEELLTTPLSSELARWVPVSRSTSSMRAFRYFYWKRTGMHSTEA